ncbi:hypothetical protein BME96_16195 [Virgibacillus halodenitrificans]|uniref:Uncharacterized protein n=1 Tax=Virgibacillus halodenitrificans TaxID=1482 RepID=A0AAC9J1Y3_VIRHA|nr:hypothetical protein [Virgibacillus halodenitrificans]APC49637.1 hypothetical protein BME96_16195 [Virgibacillus halodenitrificans]CDQ31430.1 hypothetical protein BN993_00808 [Virgibacillus halodenitrificans]
MEKEEQIIEMLNKIMTSLEDTEEQLGQCEEEKMIGFQSASSAETEVLREEVWKMKVDIQRIKNTLGINSF